jgi:hypothetical protein
MMTWLAGSFLNECYIKTLALEEEELVMDPSPQKFVFSSTREFLGPCTNDLSREFPSPDHTQKWS